jgi:hypothetical protein
MLNVGSAKRPWSGLSWNLNTSVQDHEQASYCQHTHSSSQLAQFAELLFNDE